MRSLRGRLILSHILPVLVVVPLLGLLLALLFSTQNSLATIENRLDQQAQRLAQRAELLAGFVGAFDEIWADPERAQNLISTVNMELRTVTLLDDQGRILASTTAADRDRIGELLNSEDVATILAGQRNVQIQVLEADGRSVANILMPVFDEKEQFVGILLLTETLAGIRRQFDTLYLLILLIAALLLALGIGLGSLLALRLNGSMQRVTDALYSIAEGESPSTLPEQKIVEIARLYAAVNLLVQRLRSLERSRQRLLANLVHELGRPLGSLRAAIHALRQGADRDPDLREELLAGMDGQIERMEPLLEDLTQLHGQLLGSLELKRESVLLNRWLSEVVAPWREAAMEKGIQWRADIPLDLPTVSLDDNQMARAIGNLLSNAVKYTLSGGTIAVEAGATEHGQNGEPADWWVCIRDSGIGIDQETQAQIFEPFRRGSNDSRFPQGMGLGLTIACDLAEAHGGRIEVESEPGQGSLFKIVLPVS